MPEHDLWPTALLNHYLAGPANAACNLVGLHVEDATRPWSNYMAMEIVVALLIVLVFALLRPRLSVDRPGKFQQTFELIYTFLRGQAEDAIGHHGLKYVPFFGTIFIFVLFANLIGIVPTMESPTMFAAVPLGIAMATFLYYNIQGVQALGALKYIGHFAGPIWWMAPLMFPIEIVGNVARLLSLTVRLYANMFAGEQVTMAFMGLLPLLLPLPFMALHIFVGFLQAYVFSLLTMIYVGNVLPHHEH